MSDPLPLVKRRELYIDAFRGVMALVMVQGHVFTRLLAPEAEAHPLYQFQLTFHGSTAPGFLFASGFVSGLPYRSLKLQTAVRRVRRLLFVLGVGYFLHLPFASLWKTLHAASPEALRSLYACDALQAIALTQLFVMLLQALFGRSWIAAAGVCAVAMTAATPLVWGARLGEGLHPALAALLDRSTGSSFPLFPFAAFVLAGNVAGGVIGRRLTPQRERRALVGGLALVALSGLLALVERGRIDFWEGGSPAYVVLRIGGLLLLLRLVQVVASRELPGVRPLAVMGQETLQVYVLHLFFLYGGVIGPGQLAPYANSFGFGATFAVLLLMLPLCYLPALAWNRYKRAHPADATLWVSFLTLWFCYEFLTRPW